MEPAVNSSSSPSLSTAPETAASNRQIAPAAGGITVRVVPEVVEVALHFPLGGSSSGNGFNADADGSDTIQGSGNENRRPNQATFGPGTRVLHTPYHRVVPAVGALVSLSWGTNAEEHHAKNVPPRLVRLTVQSDAPDWDAHWVKWVYSPRDGTGRRSDGTQDAAAAAQDVLTSDEQTLTLLLLQNDARREATLHFTPVLPRGKGNFVRTGDYPFTVWAHDAQTGEVCDKATGRLRLVHPPTQLLDYLPSRYREALDTLTRDENPAASYWWQDQTDDEDAGSSAEAAKKSVAPFVEPPFFTRYLRGFDDLLEPLQNALGELYTVFGTETAPSEFVPWLAQWVALSLDDNWPELRRRRLIREAVQLFRWRGTRRGLSRYLEIYAGVTPVISDQPLRGMVVGPDTRLGAGGPPLKLGHVQPHTFVVLIAHASPSSLSRATVEAIINAQKPAHTRFTLSILPKQV